MPNHNDQCLPCVQEETFRENRVGSLAVQMLCCLRPTCEYQRRPAEQ